MYLGIDLGTSEVKVLLLDDHHQVVGSAGAPLTISRPQPRWSEQNPADWWQATCAAIGQLQAGFAQQLGTVRAIGLSGQMHGAVVLDKHDQVLRPAILWNDMRSADECRVLTERAPALHQIAGNLAMPGFTAPKLLWLARHEPDLFAQIRTVLLPKDYLRWLLTGNKVSDPSDAAGTLWLDVARRDWSEELLAATGLTRAHMPALVEGSAVSGVLKPELAAQWGMAEGVVVAGGGGDNAASAVGMGATEPGDGFISLGTSGVLFVVNDRYRPNPASAVHAFCHALPGRWHQMSVILSAASSLRWLCSLLGTDEATLLDEVAALPAEARERAPLFLPYLSGERTPHNDPYAQGVLHGLTHDTNRAMLGYAVLEGVAFALQDGLDALRSAGTDVDTLSLTGGGARSAIWAQLIADVLDLRIVTHHGGEAGGALGAARLAWLAAGGRTAEVCIKPAISAEYLPDPAKRDVLTKRLQQYRAIYTRSTFRF
ncbi:xylulokinase [Andreprevotia lacus DSM 23236]|jgi:xylulokinase|uniref:Xylulose kinase n=1 Tax=Andreprevotia lacus DSM 23236 TaxID=1121001 RepID=A0A1W1XJZ9_9NEIS|nr:xylulokinase [Andreprevotia lacus]SMC23871.1 xylulokinase [Andreprevotia lacus DSM 23236]